MAFYGFPSEASRLRDEIVEDAAALCGKGFSAAAVDSFSVVCFWN
jgi:hypothetical protein